VAKDVFEKYRLETYKEASFKPFIIASMIFLTRMQSPVKKLEKFIAKK